MAIRTNRPSLALPSLCVCVCHAFIEDGMALALDHSTIAIKLNVSLARVGKTTHLSSLSLSLSLSLSVEIDVHKRSRLFFCSSTKTNPPPLRGSRRVGFEQRHFHVAVVHFQFKCMYRCISSYETNGCVSHLYMLWPFFEFEEHSGTFPVRVSYSLPPAHKKHEKPCARRHLWVRTHTHTHTHTHTYTLLSLSLYV